MPSQPAVAQSANVEVSPPIMTPELLARRRQAIIDGFGGGDSLPDIVQAVTGRRHMAFVDKDGDVLLIRRADYQAAPLFSGEDATALLADIAQAGRTDIDPGRVVDAWGACHIDAVYPSGGGLRADEGEPDPGP